MSIEFTDTLITLTVLIGIFFLAYSAIRNQGIMDTINEFRGISKDKLEELQGGIPYRNG